MKIHTVDVDSFRRFTKLQVGPLDPSTKLVVLVGPNGGGKTALFDAINTWYRTRSGHGQMHDPLYFNKIHNLQSGPHVLPQSIPINVHLHGETWQPHQQIPNGLVHVRTAHRQDADFTVQSVSAVNPEGRGGNLQRLIDIDQSVAANYQMLVGQSIEGLFSDNRGQVTLADFREELTGQLKRSFNNVFPELELSGLGNPLRDGSFYFSKGQSINFHYKNLSGGEKSVFDLLLDLTIGAKLNEQTMYLIDEPEIHTNAKIQRSVLEQMLKIVPDSGQLWIATHSFGMMNAAKSLSELELGRVAFLNFFDKNFDESTVIHPEAPSRLFWQRAMNDALDDIADLVAPKRIVLCEGKSIFEDSRGKGGFDANCYNQIFAASYPDTLFISMGSSTQLEKNGGSVRNLVLEIAGGCEVIILQDRDGRSDEDISRMELGSTRILRRREIESYLLSAEVLEAYCQSVGKAPLIGEILQMRENALLGIQGIGMNEPDEVKDASGAIFNGVKRILQLPNIGRNAQDFMLNKLAVLVPSCLRTFQVLEAAIFAPLGPTRDLVVITDLENEETYSASESTTSERRMKL